MQEFDVSELVPRGFVVESATKDDGGFVIAIGGAATVCRCPMCGGGSGSVHVNIGDDWRIFPLQACE